MKKFEYTVIHPFAPKVEEQEDVTIDEMFTIFDNYKWEDQLVEPPKESGARYPVSYSLNFENIDDARHLSICVIGEDVLSFRYKVSFGTMVEQKPIFGLIKRDYKCLVRTILCEDLNDARDFLKSFTESDFALLERELEVEG